MRKTIAVLGSALFFAVAPSSVAGLVPWWITHWEFRPPFFDLDATRAVGISSSPELKRPDRHHSCPSYEATSFAPVTRSRVRPGAPRKINNLDRL